MGSGFRDRKSWVRMTEAELKKKTIGAIRALNTSVYWIQLFEIRSFIIPIKLTLRTRIGLRRIWILRIRGETEFSKNRIQNRYTLFQVQPFDIIKFKTAPWSRMAKRDTDVFPNTLRPNPKRRNSKSRNSKSRISQRPNYLKAEILKAERPPNKYIL